MGSDSLLVVRKALPASAQPSLQPWALTIDFQVLCYVPHSDWDSGVAVVNTAWSADAGPSPHSGLRPLFPMALVTGES